MQLFNSLAVELYIQGAPHSHITYPLSYPMPIPTPEEISVMHRAWNPISLEFAYCYNDLSFDTEPYKVSIQFHFHWINIPMQF